MTYTLTNRSYNMIVMTKEETQILWTLLDKFYGACFAGKKAAEDYWWTEGDKYEQGNFDDVELAREVGDMIWNR